MVCNSWCEQIIHVFLWLWNISSVGEKLSYWNQMCSCCIQRVPWLLAKLQYCSSICFWYYWDGNGNSCGSGGWGSTCLIFEFAGRSRVGVWKVSVYLCNCAPITWQAFPWRAKPCFPKLPRKEKTCFCYKSSRNILNNSRCQVCGWFWIG